MADDTTALSDPLLIPPLSPSMFSDNLTLPDDFFQFDDDNYDITFANILNSDFNSSNPIDPQFNHYVSDPQFNHYVSDPEFIDFVSDPETVVNLSASDVSQFLNDSSPISPASADEIVTNLGNSLPESRNENTVSSQGSGNCGSGGSEGAMNCASPDSGNSVVDQKVKRESITNFMLKRKNESCDGNSESRTIKCQKSNEMSEDSNPADENDEKKKARLIRNRESAQLSRQRKKHYVEELEDKVRSMHSIIQDLNARITYFAAENATLKQQMVVNNSNNNGVCSPPVMYPPHPAMAPMGYPWIPCPPYVVKSQGSQVPLVPIPRLKPQQPASSQKSKKADVKKTEGITKTKTKTKTKKVAGISFLGLLLFIVMFGGLVPIMNVKYGGVTVTDGGYNKDFNKFYYQQHPGRVLMGDDHVNGTNHRRVHEHNASEPLVASLYVPRNDKLVKIDGNLIIHSVLASEKAMAFREEEEVTEKEDSGLAVALDLVPAISVPAVGRNGGRPPHMYRTSSNGQRVLSSDKENLKSKHADGKLQQWFREGSMLSSGMCTEVFHFNISAAIVPATATSVANISGEKRHNSTYITTVKNRRILHGLPIPLSGSTTNITKEQVGAGHDENLHKNGSVSSMVVSVLFDPREAGDGGDVEGMMGGKTKPFSRIFVVVLLDSVKYVTYSCMLPFKGASHLVKA